ncbi:MAG: UDP-N-acetylmuramate:L-alanyl-gamma-D-glutamyl-meso-diaminopimelate ligase [Desulfobacteraceae bacterium]|nr:MAG: UDP-N-acetylmuramate:L-alanyl-gamma-D-glutamyl-meso-diaminopimelate ligase [Desulfobacteraceae bacterium]
MPAEVRNIHLIAICGTAMGALACMLKEMGYAVAGSDQNVYPPMSDFLKSKGIQIFEGFDPAHLGRPDLVVVGNAVSKENVEVKAVQARQLPYCSMPQAINRFAAAGKRQIVVTGTHGKTTTSSFIAWMLHCAQLDPSFLIGGLVADFKCNYRAGNGDWIVLEGDEYDTAFFDKQSKFLHYTPKAAIITSIEFDHADIFTDLEHVKRAFQSFIERMEPASDLVVCDRDDRIAELLPYARNRLVSYGTQSSSDWVLGNVRIAPPFTFFEVFHQGRLYEQFKTRMLGEHNLFNLLSGVAVGERLGIDATTIGHALESFKGVRRRQEVRGIKNDIIIVDDFAHHPTAVEVTIRAVKSFYASRRLIAVFEPRTNSSRRNVFQSIYPACFDAADMVCVRQAPLLEKIPETQRFSSKQMVLDLRARGKCAHFFQTTEEIIDFLGIEAHPGDVVLIMSNGGFDNIHARLLDRL